MMLDGELARRRGRQTDIDDVAADRLKRGENGVIDHWTRHAAVAANHDASRRALARRPCAKPGCVPSDDFRCQRLANASANSGYTDHQPIVRHPTSIECG